MCYLFSCFIILQFYNVLRESSFSFALKGFAGEKKAGEAVFLFLSSFCCRSSFRKNENKNGGKNLYQASQLRFSCSASGSPALPTRVSEK